MLQTVRTRLIQQWTTHLKSNCIRLEFIVTSVLEGQLNVINTFGRITTYLRVAHDDFIQNSLLCNSVIVLRLMSQNLNILFLLIDMNELGQSAKSTRSCLIKIHQKLWNCLQILEISMFLRVFPQKNGLKFMFVCHKVLSNVSFLKGWSYVISWIRKKRILP